MNTAAASRDLVASPWARGIWYGLAFLALVGVRVHDLRPIIWTTSFGGSGLLCLVNVVRSRRFHCMYTGPIFLAGAAATVLRAAGAVALPWSWIGGSVFVGVVGALAWERLRGAPRGQRCC
jgi:hypothetical protein